jgi:shikimate dehydrogenase
LAKYCVIGKKLPHTLSPFLYKNMGFDYGVSELVDETELKNFVVNNTYDGYNVTIPYKKSIISHLDYVDDIAKKVGAVNTVVKKDGKSYGYNTDVEGMRQAFKKAGISIWGKNVLILGTGGTAATAEYFSRSEAAASIVKVSREGEINYNNCYEYNCTDIIINTTPVGMFPITNEIPIDLKRFPRLSGVYDAVYNPLKTKLKEEAEKIKIPSANGLYMLVAQAKKAAELYLGKILPDTLTEELFRKTLIAHTNLVLVGMPGSGKTTIGKELARLMNRPFIDIDEQIEKKEGRKIPDLFELKGETYFREIESQLLNEACSNLGYVIATGGGAVLKEDNRDSIRRNGYVVWIRRDISDLEMEGRPLSRDINALKKIESDRMHLYADISNVSVLNNSINLEVAKEIKEIYENDISY